MAGYPTSTAPSGTVPEGSTDTWSDKKRYLWLIGLVVPSLAFLAILGYASTGWGVWLWLGPIIILVVVPAIDLMTGLDRSNPPDDVIEALESDRYYRWVTYFFLPIQYAGFVGAMAIAAGHNPVAWVIDLVGATDVAVAHLPALFTGDLGLSTIDKVALAISIGCIGGIGINTAHELGHKKEANERWLSKIALAQVAYGHFYIEHNRGHHVRVATPEDPASSRLGENFYQFWPRTVGRLPQVRLADREASLRPQEAAPVPPGQRRPQCVDDDRGAVGRDDRLARHRHCAVPRPAGRRRFLAPRGRQLHGALRHAPAEGRRRRAAALRAGAAQPQLELQQHRHQRAALPPAAPQRPPRQPDPALPGAA